MDKFAEQKTAAQFLYPSIEPFDRSSIELDYIQLAPLSIYNFVSHALITNGPSPEEYDAENWDVFTAVCDWASSIQHFDVSRP